MAQSQSLISVLMPCYNARPFVRQAVQSILDQTYPHFELILIDDGSTDGTGEILKDFLSRDSRVVLLQHRHNRGFAASLNRGLDHAGGEFIARMDADDISLPERFENQIQYLKSHPEHLVCGSSMLLIDEHGKPIGKRRYPVDDSQIRRAIFCRNPIAHSSAMIRADIFKRKGIRYDPAWYPIEDYHLWMRLREIGKFHNLPSALIHYRISRHAMKSTQTKRMLMNTIRLKLDYWQQLFPAGWLVLLAEVFLLLLPASWIVFLFRKTLQ